MEQKCHWEMGRGNAECPPCDDEFGVLLSSSLSPFSQITSELLVPWKNSVCSLATIFLFGPSSLFSAAFSCAVVGFWTVLASAVSFLATLMASKLNSLPFHAKYRRRRCFRFRCFQSARPAKCCCSHRLIVRQQVFIDWTENFWWGWDGWRRNSSRQFCGQQCFVLAGSICKECAICQANLLKF